jgi:Phosphoribosylformylglycinamidine (FGAM) synthase, synthetase domain
LFENKAVDMPMQVMLGGTPRMSRSYETIERKGDDFTAETVTDLKDAIYRVLKNPTVASKSFLITIGDRSITGMVARDQFVGKWQVPVADAAVTTTSLVGYTGEAMAMGERPPVALLNPAASARLSVAESFQTSCLQKSTRSVTLNCLQTGWLLQVNKVKTKRYSKVLKPSVWKCVLH